MSNVPKFRSGRKKQRTEALLQILILSLQERDVFGFYVGRFRGKIHKNPLYNLDCLNTDALELLVNFTMLLHCGEYRFGSVPLKSDPIQNMKNMLLLSLHEARYVIQTGVCECNAELTLVTVRVNALSNLLCP